MSISLRTTTDPHDYAICADIWLASSKAGHPFIPASFWEENHTAMKEEYLPSAVIVMAFKEDTPVGFLAINEDNIAALFVLPEHWEQGIGSKLLRYALQERQTLTLTVYAQNASAIRFYKKHGFRSVGIRPCPYTDEPEIFMEWRASR